MRVLKHLLIAALLIGVVVAIAAYVGQSRLSSLAQKPLLLSEPQELLIKPGSSFRAVIDQLLERGIIDQPLSLRFYARRHQLAQRIQAGEYLLEPGLTHQAMLQMLVQGQVRTYQVTLVEGQTVRELVAVLRAHPVIEATLERSDPEAIAKLLGIAGSAEGWIYPDTYQFRRGTTDRQILQRAYQAMQVLLEQEWAERAAELPLKSAYEALILASIVEKETGAAVERPAIAGVFTRRLQKGMRLQTDPTVIYGMGEDYKGNIRSADLRRKTPYNTYRINGLPPTPIANPGRAALHAALHPEPGTALYFVAKGNGFHQFSSTLKQHNNAVSRFQRNRRRTDYRSSPALKDDAAAISTIQGDG
ncbi:MAG: UPF0755 protein [Motiliproteus sp.]|jgi:UPF0755 protein